MGPHCQNALLLLSVIRPGLASNLTNEQKEMDK